MKTEQGLTCASKWTIPSGLCSLPAISPTIIIITSRRGTVTLL